MKVDSHAHSSHPIRYTAPIPPSPSTDQVAYETHTETGPTGTHINTKDDQGTDHTPKHKFPVAIPYVKRLLEQLQRVMKKYKMAIFVKPTSTLKQNFKCPKDKILKERVVGPVYQIGCEECEATYIGETERSLKTIISVHCRPSITTSEVSRHIHTYQPCWPSHRH